MAGNIALGRGGEIYRVTDNAVIHGPGAACDGGGQAGTQGEGWREGGGGGGDEEQGRWSEVVRESKEDGERWREYIHASWCVLMYILVFLRYKTVVPGEEW